MRERGYIWDWSAIGRFKFLAVYKTAYCNKLYVSSVLYSNIMHMVSWKTKTTGSSLLTRF